MRIGKIVKRISKQDISKMRNESSYQVSSDAAVVSSRAHKKSIGSFYTPEPLANLIAHDTIFAWLSKKANRPLQSLEEIEELRPVKKEQLLNVTRNISILDPAVGDGVFLLAAGEWLEKIQVALDDDATPKELRNHIVRQCLFGVDLSNHAVKLCNQKLKQWGNCLSSSILSNLKVGNSLVGFVGLNNQIESTQAKLDNRLFGLLSTEKSSEILDDLINAKPLHWSLAFPEIFSNSSPGFDVILANPPYGSILRPIERKHISIVFDFSVGGSREGTWNSAAHFLVRAVSLMKEGAELGFLVPNSFLRVKQFSKIRNYLLNYTNLWKIVDEGSPFADVTLEMVSIFSEKITAPRNHEIVIESRRPGLEQSNVVSSSVFRKSRIFSIYHDHIMDKIIQRGEKHLLVARRGRDIPKKHVRKSKSEEFMTPYITSGRSVRRYALNHMHVFYSDDWYKQDTRLRESFEHEFLVATKNYRFPRCVLKPKGVIHGGGIVNITPLYEGADLHVLGLILNSKLVRQISIRYLTNYSQLTCCLNTGMMEDLPLVLPNRKQVYRDVFDTLSHLYSHKIEPAKMENIPILERLADALVYSLYFGDDSLEEKVSEEKMDVVTIAQKPDVVNMINKIMNENTVLELEQFGSFPPSRKTRRY
ncbi:MAG: hypothetical protein EAX87_11560 [Candidatus Thorarchaeota archaeon]|nr:hypothetical protein [Candidatus Thorarchaeota archaeon]